MTPPSVSAEAQRAPWTPAERWGAQGWLTDLDGPIYWVEFGDQRSTSAPPIVFVHGLGGSHLNWVLIGPALASPRRAIALDLPGFGLSPGTGRNCSVEENARTLVAFVDRVLGRPAVLVGNSMGAMVSLLAVHRRPDAFCGLVLIDPALPPPIRRPDPRVVGALVLSFVPVVGELALRAMVAQRSPRQMVERIMEACFADPRRASEDVLEASTALAEHRRSFEGTERWLVGAARSLVRQLARRSAYEAVMSGVQMPVLLIHGESDRIVPLAAARRAAADNPDWETLFVPGVGHTPQLESPDIIADTVERWVSGLAVPDTR